MTVLSQLVYIAMGSNVGHSRAILQSATQALANLPGTTVVQMSKVRRTKPEGDTDQPDFLNAVVCLNTALTAHELLAAVQTIEQQHSRLRDPLRPSGPRTLDLDILLYGDAMINTPELIIPHPRMWQRDFVMVPLRELGCKATAAHEIN